MAENAASIEVVWLTGPVSEFVHSTFNILFRELVLPDDKDTTVDALRREMAAFIHERDWEQFHDPKNLSMAIATEAAELMEHFRWAKNDESHDIARDPATKTAVAEELADILAFALSFANAADIDITTTLRAKMTKNARKYPADEFKGRY